MAVLTTKHTNKAPQFMGYLQTIVRASHNLEGSAWATYDAAYRRQAANRRSLDWAVIDPTIYNEAFTGRAKPLSRCRYCLADTHEARDCSYAPKEDPPQAKHLRTGSWGAGFAHTQRQDTPGIREGVVEICDLFNSPQGSRCTFKWCRFAHVCAKCRLARIRHRSVIRARMAKRTSPDAARPDRDTQGHLEPEQNRELMHGYSTD